MPRRMTNFGMGTRAQYDYQFTGYQGGMNPFAQLAQTFNSGTRAEQSSMLQARHQLLTGTIGNTLELQKHQGLSDIQFADYQRRGEHGTAALREQQHYNEEHFGHRGIVATGLDKNGAPIQTPTVRLSLQQGAALDWNERYGKFPKPSSTSGSGASTTITGTGGSGTSTGTTGGHTPPPSGGPIFPGPISGAPRGRHASGVVDDTPIGDGPEWRHAKNIFGDVPHDAFDQLKARTTAAATRNLNPTQFTPGRPNPAADTLTDRPGFEGGSEKPGPSEEAKPPSGGNGTSDVAKDAAEDGVRKVTTVRADESKGK